MLFLVLTFAKNLKKIWDYVYGPFYPNQYLLIT